MKPYITANYVSELDFFSLRKLITQIVIIVMLSKITVIIELRDGCNIPDLI